MCSPMPDLAWTMCDAEHPEIKGLRCMADVGHPDEHEALTPVRWSQ